MSDNSWGKNGNLLNGVLTLFAWVSKNREAKQTYDILSEASGIPKSTLFEIINFDVYGERRFYCELQRHTTYPILKHYKRIKVGKRKMPNDLLDTVADMFGYDYKLIRKRGMIIDVVRVNNINNICCKSSLYLGAAYDEDLLEILYLYRPIVE